MSGGASLWALAGGAALVALLSALADRGRSRRRDLDRVGWVPWPVLQILALIAAALFAGLALKS